MTASAHHNAAVHFIDRHLSEGRAAKVAFIDATGRHTYEALAARVSRVGNLFRAIGVARRDRVMICLEDSLDFVATFFGALKLGAVPIPISTILIADDYSYLVRDAAPRALVVGSALLDRVAPAADAMLEPSRVLVAGGTPGRYRALALDRMSDQLEPAAIDPDEPGFLLYSSGSTGGPKGVIHRHGDLLHTARLYSEQVLGLNASDVIFSASKMFFAYGLGNACSFPLHAGATAILLAERPVPTTVFALIQEHAVSAFFGFPTLYAALLAAVEGNVAPPLPRLRVCVSAGEALPGAVSERWAAAFGVEILDGLGSTEALHIFLANRAGDLRRGSSGKPVAGYEVAIRDDDGQPTAPNQIGDLWCRGPSIATGYWNNPEASGRTFVAGWLRTGDKYFRDTDGFYHFCGRTDDMLKVGGVWVSPHEVESALIAHPAVLEAAVVGYPDDDDLIKPKAYVVLKDPTSASPELAANLKQFVKAHIAPYKYPHWIEFRAELPKTATSKIRRALLRESGPDADR